MSPFLTFVQWNVCRNVLFNAFVYFVYVLHCRHLDPIEIVRRATINIGREIPCDRAVDFFTYCRYNYPAVLP